MRTSSICLIAVMGLLLAGCSGLRDQLGLDRHSPDEFTVVKRAPLSLPPEYSLRPPNADGTTPLGSAQTSTQDQARAAVFGTQDGSSDENTKTSAEDVFLNKVGTGSSNADIRRVLDEESGYIVLENRSTVDKILGRSGATTQDSIIDATAESERLKSNKESGRPITSGDVPVIEKKKSTLDRLF